MTPSETAKSHGLGSLAQLVKLSGVSKQTLLNWHKNYPQRFKLLCLGAKKEKECRNV